VFVKIKRSAVELGEELRDDYESEADGVGPRRRRDEDDE
jgi:hypothetical protein